LVFAILSVVSVTGFRAMGIVPVLAMTTIPVAAGWVVGGGHRRRMVVALGVSVWAVISGFVLAVWMEVPPPPAMGVCALLALAFTLATRKRSSPRLQ
jgi:ABC-type Mn2+/Zn2+ transport system permease subunit